MLAPYTGITGKVNLAHNTIESHLKITVDFVLFYISQEEKDGLREVKDMLMRGAWGPRVALSGSVSPGLAVPGGSLEQART